MIQIDSRDLYENANSLKKHIEASNGVNSKKRVMQLDQTEFDEQIVSKSSKRQKSGYNDTWKWKFMPKKNWIYHYSKKSHISAQINWKFIITFKFIKIKKLLTNLNQNHF